MEKNNKKVLRSWAIFDWANSAYSLVISTAIFPTYFVKATPPVIDLFGFSFSNAALYSFSVSFSYIIIAALSPILSGIADISGRRMFFLKTFTLIGSLNCMALYFFNGAADLWWLGTTAFILATIGFAGSLVFYDSYLPIIATEDQYDRVSAKGYSYGYIGSVLLLIFILFMIQKPEWFDIEDAYLPSRIGFLLVGLWWIGFAQITFKNLPKDNRTSIRKGFISSGYTEIRKVFKDAIHRSDVMRFLIGFFLYSAGVQTVIYLATIFAEQELHMETGELILVVLIIQLIAIAGAMFFARLSGFMGNRNTLIIQIVIWIFICVLAYFTQSKMMFYLTAALVGLVLGGIQALSRATYSKLLLKENAETDVTSYFSLYDVLYKLSIVGGTLLFGVVYQMTGNMRYAVLVLASLFLTSIFFIAKVKVVSRSSIKQ
ncbi:MAG: MFS transporter [Saprospiraceae bacterium]|nr:MFS transporter [Saprospiraceae bacterium]